MAELPRTGIQGLHTLPQQIWDDFKGIFTDNLPGWNINGIYNLQAGAETSVAAAQLDLLQHSGPHKWLNQAIEDLLRGPEWEAFTAAEKTRNLAALVNVLYEAGSKEALATLGQRTGGIVLFSNLEDPVLISHLGFRPTEADMIAAFKQQFTWSNLSSSIVGQEVMAIHPKIVNGALQFDHTLSNGSLFSYTPEQIVNNEVRIYRDSTQFSREYALAHGNITRIENGVVRFAGDAGSFEKAEKLLTSNMRLLAAEAKLGESVALAGKISAKLIGKLAIGGGALLAVALLAAPAEAAQLDKQTYSTEKKIAANRAFIEELFATATSSLAGLVAGALAGAASGGLFAVAGGVAASFVGDWVGRQIGDFFYDNFTASANLLAEWAAPLLAPIGSNIAGAADYVAGIIYSAVNDAFEYVSDFLYGTTGLFGTDGPLFGAGGPLHSVSDAAKALGFLKHDGAWQYGSFNDYLIGGKGDDVLILQDGIGHAEGGKGDDVLIGISGKSLAAGDPIFEDSATIKAETAQHLTLDGGDGNDWVLAFGGTSAADPQYAGLFNDGKSGTVTIGGAGRDWIYNTSAGGIIYGDTVDGLDPLTHQSITAMEKSGADIVDKKHIFSDNIWWSGGTVVMDAGHYDVLKFFGMPLVGGDSSGGLAFQLLGGVSAGLVGAAIGATQTFTPPKDSWYFDDLFSFINYKMDFTNGRHDMLVINMFEELFNATFAAFTGTVPRFDSGSMRIKNFDFVGSYTGEQQLLLTNSTNYDDHGTFNMIFKKANPLWAVLANLPDTAITAGLTGGGNAFGPLADIALTGAASAQRFVKAMSWSSGGDPLVLDLTGRGLNTTSIDGSEIHFDLNNDYFSERTGWIWAGAGLLALDKNGNSRIDDVTELFGSYTGSGLGDLAAYDLNHDGKIDSADAVFAKLRVWQDVNADGVTDSGELQSLSQLGIASISLNGQAVNGVTPQGTEIRTYSTFTRTDGTTSGVYDAVFGNDQTNTVYRGESGQAAWAGATAIDVKGFGRITNLAVATANDFGLAELVASRSAAMTTPDLHTLAVQAGDVLGAWGASLNLSRELTPVKTSADGKTLLDRAIYVEDATGGYYTLKSGAAVLDGQGQVIARPSFAQVLAQGAGWHVEQAWSPSTRGTALQFREAAPYLMHVAQGRAVIDDYGIQQADGSWRLASGTAIKDAQGTIIASPTKADILAQAHESGTEWRVESFGFNAFANLPVQNIGIDIVNGQVADYTVRVTDQDGSFYVWARNLDRALALQAKQGTSLAFNLRNYEVDFVKLQQQIKRLANDNSQLKRAA